MPWSGSVSLGETIDLRSNIKLSREGVWTITGYFTGEGWQTPITSQLRIAVTQDMTAIIGTKEFYSGPLAYLSNFGYGQAGKPSLSETLDPIILELDVSKAPTPQEEVLLTCRVYSLLDISDFSTQITFWKRTDNLSAIKAPEDELYIDGSLKWTGSLKKNETTQFSTKFKFLEEGDWQIHIDGNYPTSDRPDFTDNIRLNVSGNQSCFGWKNWP